MGFNSGFKGLMTRLQCGQNHTYCKICRHDAALMFVKVCKAVALRAIVYSKQQMAIRWRPSLRSYF